MSINHSGSATPVTSKLVPQKKKDRVVLVGNGMSVLGSNLGELIDSYDVVVRFSWYHIKGYEEHVGTKTNIWFTTIFCPVRIKEKYEMIYEHSWEWDANKDKTYKLIRKAWDGSIIKTSRAAITGIHKIAKKKGIHRFSEEDYNTFSTGAIATYLFLEEYEAVDIIGFDWWDLGSKDKHHYGDNQTVGRIHKPDLEYLFFSNLVKADRVVDLNSSSKLNKTDQDE